MEISIRSTEYGFQARIQLGNEKVYLVHSKEYLGMRIVIVDYIQKMISSS